VIVPGVMSEHSADVIDVALVRVLAAASFLRL